MIPALRYRVITDLHSRKPSVQAPNIMNFELHTYFNLTSLTLTSLNNVPPNPKIKLWTLVRLNTEFELQIHLNPPKISWINYLATGSDPIALDWCSSDAYKNSGQLLILPILVISDYNWNPGCTPALPSVTYY